ncbi:MAG TPA: tetraacyldisaccharide 4'-kinase, partial [Alphaproteobacteria bacterium]|nr:tetraacyldisaccharide 4'-kinase [Alphaproteobacteria bacterium]
MTRLATPAFWQQQFHPLALLLWPVGEIYKAVTHARLRHHGPHAGVPAICIGNVNVGGTGKTPIVQYAVQELQKLGRTPHIIMLGYGGQAQETTRVDLALHDAHDVGDEALLHAGIAPTWVGKDRHQSAQAAIAAGADIIVMDDGMQSPSIQPSTRWLVLDAARGIGNGYGIPAGPLREDLSHGLRRVDAIILVGEGDFMPQTDKPVLRVKIETDEVSRQNLKDKLIYAFAGIGQPEKLVF